MKPSAVKQPPVPPEKGSPEPTKEQILEKKGEGFFLYAPKTDVHTFGRDDLMPIAEERKIREKHLYSPVSIQDERFPSSFNPVEPGKWIIRGTRHFASMKYEKFKNFTGIACCVASLAMCQKWRCRTWNESLVDDVLDMGYNLYIDSMRERRGPIRRLVLGEIAERFKTRTKEESNEGLEEEFSQISKGIAVWGRLHTVNTPNVFDLDQGLRTFFKSADSGILQIANEYETAIWREGYKNYMFHPGPADEQGYRVGLQGGGKACLLRVDNVDLMCEHFLKSTKDLKGRGFNISDVKVTSVGK